MNGQLQSKKEYGMTLRVATDKELEKRIAEYFRKNPHMKKQYFYADAIREKLAREEKKGMICPVYKPEERDVTGGTLQPKGGKA